MDERELQRMNAPLFMLVTVPGMLTELRFLHSAKAPGPTLVIPSAITTDLIESLYGYQGVSVFMAHAAISPEPVMVSVPPLSSHFAFVPQTPDSPTLFSDRIVCGRSVLTAHAGAAADAVTHSAADRAAAISLFMFFIPPILIFISVPYSTPRIYGTQKLIFFSARTALSADISQVVPEAYRSRGLPLRRRSDR